MGMESALAISRNEIGNKGWVKYRSYYLLFVTLLLLQLCPIWFAAYPAMHDYPNHLARAHILHEYDKSDSYQNTYNCDGRLIPNLSMDLNCRHSMNMWSIETSSRIFLSLVVVVFNGGLHLLGVAVNNRPHWNVLVRPFHVQLRLFLRIRELHVWFGIVFHHAGRVVASSFKVDVGPHPFGFDIGDDLLCISSFVVHVPQE